MVYHPLAWNVNVSVSGIALGGGPLSIVCISHIICITFLLLYIPNMCVVMCYLQVKDLSYVIIYSSNYLLSRYFRARFCMLSLLSDNQVHYNNVGLFNL